MILNKNNNNQEVFLELLVADKKKFSADTLGVNLEVLKLLHLCMDCYKVCFKW